MTQLMEQIKEKDAQAFTHSGKFHADDVFSSALLLSVNPEITIHRGSQVPEDFKGIVFDIGRGKYDHHQRDSRIRENGVPYAAFGLLWEELGAEILGEELAEKFDEAFVQPLDNNDNTGEKNELATLIGNFNPPWDAQGGNDAAFFKAVGVAGMILDNKLERYRGNERADKRVEEILKQHQEEIASGKKPADEKQILVLPDYVPCQKYLSETDIAFVIFPSNRGGYCIQPQKREYSLNYKCSFPESWLGLEKEELKEESGLSGAVNLGTDEAADALLFKLPQFSGARIVHMELPDLPPMEWDGIYGESTLEKQEWKAQIKDQVKKILKSKPEAVYVQGDLFAVYPLIHALRKRHMPVLVMTEMEGEQKIVRIPSGS